MKAMLALVSLVTLASVVRLVWDALEEFARRAEDLKGKMDAEEDLC